MGAFVAWTYVATDIIDVLIVCFEDFVRMMIGMHVWSGSRRTQMRSLLPPGYFPDFPRQLISEPIVQAEAAFMGLGG